MLGHRHSVALVCALLGACASGSKGATGTSVAASGSSGGGSNTTSGSGSSTTSGGSTSGAAAYVGVITLSQTPASAEQTPPLGSASVVFTSAGAAAPTCAGTQSGACCYQTMGTSVAAPASVSAGTVAFTDNGAGIGHVAYGTSTYPPLTSTATPTFTWLPGDTLGVRNGGSTVDKFTGSVVAPQAVVGLVPAPGPTALSIPRSQDLAVSWTPSGDAQLTFALTDTMVASITCTVADSAGALTVPTALLSRFASGDSGSIVVTRQNVTNPPLSTSNATVTVTAAIAKFGSATFQ